MDNRSDSSEAEIRLMGLILSQSALVGLAIGLFDAGLWLTTDDAMVNGFTYAMAAFFVQGIAYYFFKMFFEQNMQERVRAQNVERTRTSRFRNMQSQFDNRRTDMEMRMQEAQLEQELRWMENNPGKMPPSWGVQGGSQSLITEYDNMLTQNPPQHNAEIEQPINLGIAEEEPEKKK
tara:strand:- start:3954 stop:4484 length:531 start_codon:yes stop_codon:yes gene_type:complete